MDSPINRMIDRASNRKAASSVKAKAKRTTALNDQVLSLVAEANATALPERQVTPRAALIVMSRAMKELSSLSEESRAHGVLREVSKFISLNQKTLLASVSMKHVDLLPKGHPLSPLNASLTDDDLRKKYSEWIAADPAIADEARPLVAMAHSLPPESIEREHAFLRLRTLQASAVPAYFKIDDVTAITAAFMSGNSSAARSARVALQWRDRVGRWIEMGRGINFRFRLPDGSVVTGRGNYVGAGSNPRVERTSKGTSLISDTGLIEVSGVPGLQPGLYAIGSDNAAAYQARIPGFEAPQAPSFEDQFDADIPNVSDLQAVRRELPIGWKKQGPYYVSDDNYAVVPGPTGQPQMVTRLNADGRPAGTIGNARDWNEVNSLIEKDQPSFDKEIARIEAEGEEGQLPLARIPGATEDDVVSFDDIANMQKQRAEENKKFDAARPAPKPLGDKDLNGNVVPKAWVRDANDDTKYTREMPLRDGGTYPLIARVNEDGTYIAGHAGGWIPEPGTDGRGASRKFESWDEIKTEGIPDFVDYLNETFTKNNPIVLEDAVAGTTKNVKGFDVPADSKLVAMEQNGDAIVVQMPDGSLVQYDTGGPEGIPYTQEQKDKFINDIKADETIWFDEEGKTNWKALLEGSSGSESVSGASDLGDYKNSPDFIKKADEITKDWPTIDYATYIAGREDFLPLPEGSKLVATGLGGQDENQLFVKLPDGNYIIVGNDDGSNEPYYEQIQSDPEENYDVTDADGNEITVNYEGMMLNRLTSYDPYSGWIPLNRYGYFKEFGVPGHDDRDDGKFAPPSDAPQGMKLDFADPEQAARDAGLPADASFNDIAKAWFDQNIKPVAPTAKLDGFEEGGPDGPSVSITADNDEDLLNAFRVYFGDDEATLEDLRDNSEEYSKKDLVEIDKATLDALDKRMREDSTGEYSMEGVMFSSNNNGDIIMYPDGWEPGDKIIGRVEDDGGIDWESDAQYDKYADNVREALRGMGSGSGGGGGDGDTGKPVTYQDAAKIAEDTTLTPSQKLHELFKNAKAVSLRDYIETNEMFQERPIDPSLDIDNAEVVEVDGDGQNLLVRYPDNTYYSVDAGGYTEIDGVDYISSVGIDALGDDAVNDYFRDLLDAEDPTSGPFYRGYWIDQEFQKAFVESFPDDEGDAPGGGDTDKPFVFNDEDYDPATFTFRKKEKINDSNFYSWDVSVALPGGETNDYIYGIRVDDDGTVEYTTSDGMYGDASGIPGEIFPIEVVEYMENYIKDKYPDDTLPPRSEGDGSSDEPPSRPTGGGNPGSGFTDYVIDLAEDNSDLGKDLEERLDDDATDVGAELMDQIYDDASRRYELSQDIADNKPEGMSDDEFVRDAVAKMREQLSSIVDSAIDERRAFEDDEELEVDFDKKAFIDAGAKRFEELLREELDNMGEDDEGPDEPPSPGGGTPPKVPSPSTPGSPALFGDFDKPAGAYQLRTTEYEPEGRIDEASTDFTDDPRRLATKFSLDDLVTAFTEALIGRPDEAAMQDILNANVDENDDLPDLADLADVAESNAPRATANNASGAGALEFNAGEEYVLAESLYNAVYEAGGDPNRVIANAYDAVNGNRNNAQKILEAQGGVSSPEEVKLIEDMTDEIRQIKDATPEGESPVANQKSKPEEKFAGSLIENVPVDYNNPDYFDMDSDAYVPAQPEIDENGYTDNPEILALDYESADLIEQMLEGITDGSGVALLDFGGEDGVHEVPIEALRDAIQLQDINTNDILFKLRDESNDMSDDPGDLEDMIDNLEDPESPAKPSGMPEQISNQKIKDKNDGEFELNLVKIGDVYEGALISKSDNRVQIVVRDRDEKVAKKALKEAGAYIKQAANGDEAMYDGVIPDLDRVDQPQASETPTLQAHSQMIKDLLEQAGTIIDDEKADQIRDAIDQENMLDWSEADDADIISAITDIVGPGIVDISREIAAGERRLPPTTGQRQAPVDSADKPRDPSVDAPSARPARESSEGFSPFSDVASELDDTVDDMVVELLDRSANTIVQWFMGRVSGVSLLAFNSRNGEIAVRTPESRSFVVKSNGIVTDLTMDPSTADSFFAETGSAFGWEPVPQEVMDAIVAESIRRYPDVVQEPAPAAPEGTPEAPAAPAAPVPVFTYPGPREAGYTANNTTLASDGSVIGAGSIVTANRDGKRGVVVSIQNDPEYARIRFEDGKIAVRSANQIKAVSNPDGTLAMLPSGAAQPSGVTPSTDVESRLNAPIRPAPNVARSGSAWGINDATDVPDFIKPLVKQDVSQSVFSAWGERDGEIAKAASTRASLDSLLASVDKYEAARERGEAASVLRALKDETNKILSDIYGGRDGISFGVDSYKVNTAVTNSSLTVRTPANGRATKSYSFSISFYLTDNNGRRVGGGSRSIYVEDTTDENGNPVRQSSVKNDILEITGANKKKGFASGYNRYMENWYIANGIDKVKVYAAGGGKWQGAFVWALNGFDWESASTAREMVRSLERAARTPEEKDIAKKLADKVDAASGDIAMMPTPLEVALAGWYPGAKKWFGKDVIIGRSWNGVKHLKPTAREQLQAVNYNQIKNAERRIQAGQNKPGTSAVGLAQTMDNSFQTNNPELGAYIDQIRDALKNNRSLAFLSPAAKSALGQFVSKELLNKNSNMPMEDLFRLQTALSSEYRAENDYSNPFGAIEDALAGFTMTDFYRNSDELKAAGFSAKSLAGDDSGVNDTFMVTHKPSGQVFFVKEEKLSRSYYGTRGLTSEVEANTIMNALEMMGVPSVRGSRTDKDIIIMSQAGATLPLAAPAENASTMMNYGITDANGDIFASDSGANFVDLLRNPADVFNMAIVDMLGAGQDRHDANWMAAFDKTDNRLFMFPIDNSLLTVDKNESGIEDFFISVWPDAGDVYEQAVSRIIRSAGEERAAEMFMNQVRKLITNLDNPLFQPKGEELAALIDKWGTYDAFKDELKKRLTTIVTPGSAENKALINSMKMSYWR